MLYTDKVIYLATENKLPIRVVIEASAMRSILRRKRYNMTILVGKGTRNKTELVTITNAGGRIMFHETLLTQFSIAPTRYMLIDEEFDIKGAFKRHDIVLTPRFVHCLGGFWDSLTIAQKKEIASCFTFNESLGL